jgi:hypothetical protein
MKPSELSGAKVRNGGISTRSTDQGRMAESRRERSSDRPNYGASNRPTTAARLPLGLSSFRASPPMGGPL